MVPPTVQPDGRRLRLFTMARRMTRAAATVLIAVSFALGSYAGGALVWSQVPAEWELPFWTTLEASVDSERYGHAVEHAAENILVFVVVAGVVCGALCAAIMARSLAKRRTAI